MAMSDRQIQKEILRLRKEIDLLESQIQSGMKSKADKEQENKRLEDDIANQEKENASLAEQLDKHTNSITELDEEFKDNQLKAGRIRKEMNLIKEDVDAKKKEEKNKKTEIERILSAIEDAKRKIKEEKRAKETSEYNLRKTNAKVAEIQSHRLSWYVTRKIKKDALKAGRKTDEITKTKEDIEAYEAAVKESQLAQVGHEGEEPEEEMVMTDVAKEPGTPKQTPPAEEKKEEKEGLDLTY